MPRLGPQRRGGALHLEPGMSHHLRVPAEHAAYMRSWYASNRDRKSAHDAANLQTMCKPCNRSKEHVALRARLGR